MSRMKWGASPLSSAVNWLARDVFNTRKSIMEAASSTPSSPTAGILDFSDANESALLVLLEDI